MPSLTHHLLTVDPQALKRTTTHPFLSTAATASLPREKLIHWLAQDRLYQHAYIAFLGCMLAHIGIPSGSERESSLEWRAADLCIDTLCMLRDEMRMFEDTAREEGFYEDICGVEANVQTRAYQDLFAGATARGRPLVVGLVVLWGTEEAYLRSWKHAKARMEEEYEAGSELDDGKKDVMQRTFIPNWTSPDFEAFVRRAGALVNRFGGYLEEGGFEWKECEQAWRQVLWAEEGFWPDVEG